MDLQHLRASDGTGEAVLAHIQSVRNPGSTVLDLDNVDNWNSKAVVVTGTPAANGFISPVGMKVMYGHLNAGDFIIDGYAPGYADNGNTTSEVAIVKMTTSWADALISLLGNSLGDDGFLKVTALDKFFKPVEVLPGNFVASGGVVAISAGLTGTFSDIVFYISGLRYVKTGVANKVYTASKDTYVDIDNTGTVTYTEVANGVAAPVIAAGRIRLAKVVTNGGAITGITQYKQGLLPVGYSQKRYSNGTGAYATGGATALFAVDSTNLKAPLLIRSGKLVRVDLELSGIWNQNTGYTINIDVGLDGAATKSNSGTQSISPAGYGNNWTTDGAARVTWNGTFYFEDVSPGYHDFLLLWATSNASFGGFLGQYAQQTITVTEMA